MLLKGGGAVFALGPDPVLQATQRQYPDINFGNARLRKDGDRNREQLCLSTRRSTWSVSSAVTSWQRTRRSRTAIRSDCPSSNTSRSGIPARSGRMSTRLSTGSNSPSSRPCASPRAFSATCSARPASNDVHAQARPMNDDIVVVLFLQSTGQPLFDGSRWSHGGDENPAVADRQARGS